MTPKANLLFTVNDRFQILADTYCYHLVETYEGINRKTKEPKQQQRTSYYPSLEQCLRAVKDAEVKQCSGVQEILEALQRSYTISETAASLLPKPEGKTI